MVFIYGLKYRRGNKKVLDTNRDSQKVKISIENKLTGEIKTYPSMIECSQQTGINKSVISAYAKHNRAFGCEETLYKNIFLIKKLAY